MKQKPEHSFKKTFTNAFGALGYFFGFLEWFWAIMLYFSVLKAFTLFVSPSADQSVEQHPAMAFTPPSPVEGVIITVITVVMVLVSIYVLIKMPSTVVKTSSKMVRKTTDSMAPLVIKAQHVPDTKKARAKLTAKLMVGVKLLLVIMPLGLTAGSGLLEKQSVDYSIAMVVGCTLAIISLFFFVIQYTVAALFRLKLFQIW